MDNPEIKNLVDDPSFVRWVRGRATAQECTYWDNWLVKSHENRSLAKKAQAEIAGFTIRPAVAPEAKDAWNHLQRTLAESQGRSNLLKRYLPKESVWYARIAAVFLLAALTGLLITKLNVTGDRPIADSAVHEVVTAAGELKTVMFSDGSEVILNGNSKIRYVVTGTDSFTVDLHLTGEAYFSVADRRHRQNISPFRVQTDEGLIQVLGTRFAVSNRDHRTRVILEEGSLSVKPIHQELETILESGQLAMLESPYEDVEIRQVDTALYSSWIRGRIEFDQAEVEDVMERLEDLFDIRIEIRDQTILGKRISGSIEDNDLHVIVSALSKMLDTPVYRGDQPEVYYFGDPE